MIPNFPKFKEIALEDKAAVDKYLNSYQPTTCELNFTNLYIWRNFDHPKLTIINDNLCVLIHPEVRESSFFLPPMGNNKIIETAKKCLGYLQEQGLPAKLSRFPEALIKQHFAQNTDFRLEEDRNNADYVYLASDLAELKGRKYDGKRNHLAKLSKKHSFTYRRIETGLISQCLQLTDKWHKAKNVKYQDVAIVCALKHLKELGLIGGAILIDDKVEAFSIGQKLNHDTADIFIELSNPDIPGMANLINREFVRQEWLGCKFINREQDLGIPGIRKSKLSYYPHHLENKYNVYLA